MSINIIAFLNALPLLRPSVQTTVPPAIPTPVPVGNGVNNNSPVLLTNDNLINLLNLAGLNFAPSQTNTGLANLLGLAGINFATPAALPTIGNSGDLRLKINGNEVRIKDNEIRIKTDDGDIKIKSKVENEIENEVEIEDD
jgi:hypothetical protein